MNMTLKRVLPALLLVSTVSVVTWFYISSNETPVTHVRLTGSIQHLDQMKAVDAIKPFLGEPFFDVDIKGIAKQLRKLPWVAQVGVSRRWPDGITVTITEHQPIARWGDKKVLTKGQHVIAPLHKFSDASLPVLAGPDDQADQVWAKYQTMDKKLKQAGAPELVALKLDQRGAWRGQLANGLILCLGRDHVSARLSRFINYALVQAADSLTQAGYVDLRYSDGFAVGGERKAPPQGELNEQKA